MSSNSNLRQIPLTCSGHTRPVVHLDFSDITECSYFLISACKGEFYHLLYDLFNLKFFLILWQAHVTRDL